MQAKAQNGIYMIETMMKSIMNKPFAYLILCFSCLVMVMSSCKDDHEKETDYPIRPIPVEDVIQGNNQLVAVTGDTVTIKWSAGFVFCFGIDWLEWWYDDNNQKSYTTISEMMETTTNNDTIDGGWFKISPTRLSGRFCEEVRVIIDSNATGKRRALYIKPATAMFAPAYVFQECEELPAAPEDSNED